MWLPNYLVISLVFALFLTNVLSIKDQITIERIKELKAQLNLSVDPCDDFFEYSCGNYKTVYPIPDYKARLDVFERMSEENYEQLDRLLRKDIDDILRRDLITAEDKTKVFYSLCNNITAIDNQALKPLLTFIESIGGFPARTQNWINPNFNWFNLIKEVHKITGKNPLFDFGIEYRDPLNITTKTIPVFGPPITSIDRTKQEKLRSILREFGLTETNVNNTIEEYYGFFDDLQSLSDFMNPEGTTAHIIQFERWAPGLNWKEFLDDVYGIVSNDSDYMSVFTLGYFDLLTCFLNKRNPAEITNFVVLNLINDLIPVLDQRFLNMKLEDEKRSIGFKSGMPRWRYCIEIIIDVLNKPTAALYIKGAQLSKARQRISEISTILKSTFKAYLQNSAWPGARTKSYTLNKLDKFELDLSWENVVDDTAAMDNEFRSLKIDQSSFFETYLSAMRLKVLNIGLSVVTQTREIWPYPLVSAEAFAAPWWNKFSIHPGLMRSPVYHINFPKFLEFTSLGGVVAHEMFHSFDTFGSNYNADGLLENWWVDKDYAEFQKRTKCFIDQYNSYTINGTSLKERPGDYENIADNSGTHFAYMAYDNFLNANPNLDDETVEGLNLTSRQLFFVAMAQLFCTQLRPEAAKYFITTDPHAAGPWRIIGIVQNSEDFATQFNCPKNSRMNPDKKCHLYS